MSEYMTSVYEFAASRRPGTAHADREIKRIDSGFNVNLREISHPHKPPSEPRTWQIWLTAPAYYGDRQALHQERLARAGMIMDRHFGERMNQRACA